MSSVIMCDKIITGLLVFWATVATGLAADEALVRRYDVDGLAGEGVRLPCEVDRAKCGVFHSIKWYKDSVRVFIFSDMSDVNRAEGLLLDRTDFHYAANDTNSSLEIFPLNTLDEGTYKCEITYLTVQEACSVVQFVNLTTYALPGYLQMTFEDGSPIANGSVVGPFDEGTTITLACESGGGKPVASVTWWNGTQQLTGDYLAIPEADGSGLGRNVLRLPLTRAALGSNLACQADNPALVSPFMGSVTLDVNVPPYGVEVTGGEQLLHEEEMVTLTCVARGAKPPAKLTWLNGTTPFSDVITDMNVEEESRELLLPDNTFESRSRLTFAASRFENEQTFKCEASNVVLENRGREPMSSEVELDVLYAPIVRVSPENVTVNETHDILIFCQYHANPKQLTHVNWYQDLRIVDVAGNPEKYGNGNIEHPTLLIKNSTASDMGKYTCRLSNEVGASVVEDAVNVSVLYRPTVEVVMDPMEPVSEEDRVNVTLICSIVKANPRTLLRVRWYLDGILLKELPECDGNSTSPDSTNTELCDIDPSRLLLENVYKEFHGNYSCEGMNNAGWGSRSGETELIVHYSPGQALITYQPSMVIKGKALELTCNIDDPGRPAATTFRWYRGSHLVPDQTSALWTINPVSLETKDSFTCVPVNIEGEGERSTVEIDVLAAPLFIDRLPPYHGVLMNDAEVSLSCRVECSPLCSVDWLKNNLPLHNRTHYEVKSKVMPPDPSSGDLESVVSHLTWRMDKWTDGSLDRDKDTANYTCTSSDNLAGLGVESTVFFKVEFPPEDIYVSETYIRIVENEKPPKVQCNASAYPEPTYIWQHKGQTVSTGAVLDMDYKIQRGKAGEYKCIAQNRHGQISESATFDVLFKPECKIDRTDGGTGEDSHILLICRAEANPEDVTFRWRTGNETFKDVASEGLESRLRLPATADSLGTYSCFVNNTIGESIACEIDVTGMAGIIHPGDDNIIVISAIVAAVIVLVIIICVVIILICRRQRQAGKYPEGTKPPATGPKDNGVPSPDDENKQTFYENLPFHGMQPPPNKNRKNTNYGTAQNPTPSSSSSSSSPSPSSSHYQYQPQYQRNQQHPSLYKQYPSSSSLKEAPHPTGTYNSSSSRQSYSSSTYPHRLENQSHPPTAYPNSQSHLPTSYPSTQSHAAAPYPSSQSHPVTSYPNTQSHPATSYPTSQSHPAASYPNSQSHVYPPNSQPPTHHKYGPGVVYADLKLPRNGHPNQSRRDLNTEYAILQFNGPIVGQEIDV